MEIKKIKASRIADTDMHGPCETITLGIEINGNTFIFGSYYFGPGMSNGRDTLLKQTEDYIDYMVGKCGKPNDPQSP